eukprot:scaffold434376_cov53-Prasinocladus_malaysianus.AAC.1
MVFSLAYAWISSTAVMNACTAAVIKGTPCLQLAAVLSMYAFFTHLFCPTGPRLELLSIPLHMYTHFSTFERAAAAGVIDQGSCPNALLWIKIGGAAGIFLAFALH